VTRANFNLFICPLLTGTHPERNAVVAGFVRRRAAAKAAAAIMSIFLLHCGELPTSRVVSESDAGTHA
jgi:hypothetical protein